MFKVLVDGEAARLCKVLVFPPLIIKVGCTFRGSNSAIFILIPLRSGGKKRSKFNFAHFEREVNRKSQKLFPIIK